MEMWFQDGLAMDTYATTAQQAVVLPQQTPAPSTSDGGTSANAAAAAQSIENSAPTPATNLVTALQNLVSLADHQLRHHHQRSVGAWPQPRSRAIRGHIERELGRHSAAVRRFGRRYVASDPGHLLRDHVRQHARQDADQPGQLDGRQPGDAGGPAGHARRRPLTGRRQAESLAGQHLRPDARVRIADHRSAGAAPESWAACRSRTAGRRAAPQMVRAAPILPANSIAAPCVCGNAHQPVHPSPHGCAQRARHGHAGRQDGSP